MPKPCGVLTTTHGLEVKIMVLGISDDGQRVRVYVLNDVPNTSKGGPYEEGEILVAALSHVTVERAPHRHRAGCLVCFEGVSTI